MKEEEEESEMVDLWKWKEGKYKGKKLYDKDYLFNLKKFKYDIYYEIMDDDVYYLKDLIMLSLVDFVMWIGYFVVEELILYEVDVEVDDVWLNLIDFEIEKKKKKYKKKKGGKKKYNYDKDNWFWYIFIEWVFVEIMSFEDIED